MRGTIRRLRSMSLHDLGEGLVRRLDRETEKIWAAHVLESVDKPARNVFTNHWQDSNENTLALASGSWEIEVTLA